MAFVLSVIHPSPRPGPSMERACSKSSRRQEEVWERCSVGGRLQQLPYHSRWEALPSFNVTKASIRMGTAERLGSGIHPMGSSGGQRAVRFFGELSYHTVYSIKQAIHHTSGQDMSGRTIQARPHYSYCAVWAHHRGSPLPSGVLGQSQPRVQRCHLHLHDTSHCPEPPLQTPDECGRNVGKSDHSFGVSAGRQLTPQGQQDRHPDETDMQVISRHPGPFIRDRLVGAVARHDGRGQKLPCRKAIPPFAQSSRALERLS